MHSYITTAQRIIQSLHTYIDKQIYKYTPAQAPHTMHANEQQIYKTCTLTKQHTHIQRKKTTYTSWNTTKYI